MVEINPRWWIGKDSLRIGKDSLGIVYDVTHCYNRGKKCLPAYYFGIGLLMRSLYSIGTIGLPRLARVFLP